MHFRKWMLCFVRRDRHNSHNSSDTLCYWATRIKSRTAVMWSWGWWGVNTGLSVYLGYYTTSMSHCRHSFSEVNKSTDVTQLQRCHCLMNDKHCAAPGSGFSKSTGSSSRGRENAPQLRDLCTQLVFMSHRGWRAVDTWCYSPSLRDRLCLWSHNSPSIDWPRGQVVTARLNDILGWDTGTELPFGRSAIINRVSSLTVALAGLELLFMLKHHYSTFLDMTISLLI